MILPHLGEGDRPKGGGEGCAADRRLGAVFDVIDFADSLQAGAPPAPPCSAWSPSPKRERINDV